MGKDHTKFKGETVKIMVTLPDEILSKVDMLISDNNLFYNRTYFISFAMGSVLFRIKNPKTVINGKSVVSDEEEAYTRECKKFRDYIFTDRSLIKSFGKLKDTTKILAIVPKGVVDGLQNAVKSINEADIISMNEFARYSVTYYYDELLLGSQLNRCTYSKIYENKTIEDYGAVIKEHAPEPGEYLGPKGTVIHPIKKGRTAKYE